MWRKIVYAALGLMLVGGLVGCSRDKVVAPPPAPPAPLELHYDARFNAQEGTFTLKQFEYADASGVVHQVDPSTGFIHWTMDQALERGDRLYMRAELEYTSVFVGILQVHAIGPESFARNSRCERIDGPNSAVLVIDEVIQ
jgi:hypothetical protein